MSEYTIRTLLYLIAAIILYALALPKGIVVLLIAAGIFELIFWYRLIKGRQLNKSEKHQNNKDDNIR